MNRFFKLTGGRPMIYEGHGFIDTVDGRSVNYYRDCFGRKWMANSAWSRFRVSRDQ